MAKCDRSGLYRYDWTRRTVRVNQKVWVNGANGRPVPRKVVEHDVFTRRHPGPSAGYVARVWLEDSVHAELLGDEFQLSPWAAIRERSAVRYDKLVRTGTLRDRLLVLPSRRRASH